MKKALLLSLAVASGLGISAQNEAKISLVSVDRSLKPAYVTANNAPVKVERLNDKGVMLKKFADSQGRVRVKRIENPADKRINPFVRRAARAAGTYGSLLNESFEEWDGFSHGWFPQGWSSESNGDASLEAFEKWSVFEPNINYGMAPAADGKYVAGVNYSVFPQDEWLMTPAVTVEENQILKFHLLAQPFFLYDQNYVDWDNMEFTERNVICDLHVLVREEGASEWTELWKLSDVYASWTFDELVMFAPDEMKPFSLNISQYVGKTVEFAFQYKGRDGDTMYIDAVNVGFPELEDISFANPPSTLYWGFGRMEGWDSFSTRVAFYPVCSPITWENNSQMEGATYTWTYHDPETNDLATFTDPYSLSVTYKPDYTNEFTTRNNWLYPPTLTASAPGASDGVFKAQYDFMQAGGKTEYKFEATGSSPAELWEAGVLPFEMHSEGTSYMIIDDSEIGDMALPIFGYNCNVDTYWTNYTLNGESPETNDVEAHLTAIMNYLFPSTSPMVISGVHVQGIGIVPGVQSLEFKIEIVPLVEGVPQMDAPIAVATCPANKIVRADYGANQLLTIPFDFDKPAVIMPEDEGYMVKFSGFRDLAVEYFAPLQSLYPNPDGYALGWLVKEIRYNGSEYVESYSPIANIEGEYGPCLNAFAMNLSAVYPWLESDVTEVNVPAGGEPVEVALSSYYDGKDLEIAEAVCGVDAEIEGRYGECVLTLRHNNADVIADGTLKITGPGVELSIKVTEGTSSVDKVDTAAGAVPVAAYAPDGRKVNHNSLGNGIYIVKYSDGTTAKVCR